MTMIVKNTTALFQRHVLRRLSINLSTNSNIILSPCRKCCNVSSCLPVSSKYTTCSKVTHSFLSTHNFIPTCFTITRSYASDQKPNRPTVSTNESQEKAGSSETSEEVENKLSLYQRFKLAYKKHGYVLIGVHLFTSVFWAGGFYYMVTSGVDVIAILEYLHFSEKTIEKMRHSSLGTVALAYLLYKIATPARYTVTLAGTRYAIKYFQRQGKIPKPYERERLKDLVKDGRKELKSKVKDGKEELKAKVKEESKELKEKVKDTLKK